MIKLAFACAKLSLITGGFLAIFTGLHFVALEYLVPKPEIETKISDLKEIKVRAKQENKTINVGEKLQIKLQENISAGFTWIALWNLPSSDYGELKHKGYSGKSSKALGTGHFKIFEFEAKSAGSLRLVFICLGPGAKVIGYYRLTLTVKQ